MSPYLHPVAAFLRRAAYALAVTVTAALLVALAMTWGPSYTASEVWCFRPERYTDQIGRFDVVSDFCVGWSRGYFIVLHAHVEGELTGEPLSPAVAHSRHSPHVFGVPENSWLPRIAFRAYPEMASTSIAIQRHRLDVSHSLLALALALPPAVVAWRKHRRRLTRIRREQTGLCPRCGYDVRASLDRCPECGWTKVPA
jgi:hypothetical protein